MTVRVWVADKCSPKAKELLEAAGGFEVDVNTGLSPEEQAKIIGGYDAMIVRSATKLNADLLAHAAKLKLAVRAGIGVDNIDLDAAAARGVQVENTPLGNTVTTAEHAIGLLFAVARMVPQANATMHAGKWDKKRYMGVELTGKTLGVIGTGNIGSIVCRRAQGLAMNVVAFDPGLTSERAAELGVTKVDLDTLLASADFITLHVPLLEATKHLLDDAAFAKMKPGVRIVQASRGGVLSEAALLRALDAGTVAGAALDVFETEPLPESALRGRDDVILTPHIGASTHDAQVNVAVDAAKQIVAFFKEGQVIHAKNTPAG